MTVNVPEDVDNVGDISSLWMMGKEVQGSSWMREGIKNYQVQLPVTPDLERLIRKEEQKAQEARAAATGVPVAVSA